ncbi:MAG: hypothetical protein ACJ786_37190 [Catenulispora sp.]
MFGQHPFLSCEHVFVSIKGSSYARFKRAIEVGNLTLIRSAASELPQVDLDDALRVCRVVARDYPDELERHALRWLGRFALERARTVEQVRLAAGAFARARLDPDRAFNDLARLAAGR